MLNALVQHGFGVLLPFGDGHPYDLALRAAGDTFVRVQCKMAWPHGGCALFNSHSTDHGRGPRSYIGLADVFGVYFPPRDAVYLVPVAEVSQHEGRLRLDPPRNNQRRRVRFAGDFDISRWTPERLAAVVGRSAGTGVAAG